MGKRLVSGLDSGDLTYPLCPSAAVFSEWNLDPVQSISLMPAVLQRLLLKTFFFVFWSQPQIHYILL